MHNCRSTRQQRLQKEEITGNRSDNDALSFRSITKIAAIQNPHTTQKITDRKQVVYRVVDHNYSYFSVFGVRNLKAVEGVFMFFSYQNLICFFLFDGKKSIHNL